MPGLFRAKQMYLDSKKQYEQKLAASDVKHALKTSKPLDKKLIMPGLSRAKSMYLESRKQYEHKLASSTSQDYVAEYNEAEKAKQLSKELDDEPAKKTAALLNAKNHYLKCLSLNQETAKDQSAVDIVNMELLDIYGQLILQLRDTPETIAPYLYKMKLILDQYPANANSVEKALHHPKRHHDRPQSKARIVAERCYYHAHYHQLCAAHQMLLNNKDLAIPQLQKSLGYFEKERDFILTDAANDKKNELTILRGRLRRCVIDIRETQEAVTFLKQEPTQAPANSFRPR